MVRGTPPRLIRLLSQLPPLRGILPLVLFLTLWQAINPVDSPYFPPPRAWWSSVVDLAARGLLVPAIGATLATFFGSLSLATLIAGTVGIGIGMSRLLSRALGPLLEFCRALPPPVIVPVAVLLLGYNESLKLLVVTWAAMWPILLNTSSATRHIDPLLLEVGRTFRLARTDIARKIVIPAVVPALLLGVRVAVPLAVIVTLLVEMLTLLPGIGSLIVVAQREFQPARVYGLLALVGMLGFLLNSAFIVLESFALSRWPQRAGQAN